MTVPVYLMVMVPVMFFCFVFGNGFGYGFGSVRRTTYFFNCDDGIWVRCGCFFGDIEQFRERVKKTRKGKLGKEYLMIADLVEMKWKYI